MTSSCPTDLFIPHNSESPLFVQVVWAWSSESSFSFARIKETTKMLYMCSRIFSFHEDSSFENDIPRKEVNYRYLRKEIWRKAEISITNATATATAMMHSSKGKDIPAVDPSSEFIANAVIRGEDRSIVTPDDEIPVGPLGIPPERYTPLQKKVKVKVASALLAPPPLPFVKAEKHNFAARPYVSRLSRLSLAELSASCFCFRGRVEIGHCIQG